VEICSEWESFNEKKRPLVPGESKNYTLEQETAFGKTPTQDGGRRKKNKEKRGGLKSAHFVWGKKRGRNSCGAFKRKKVHNNSWGKNVQFAGEGAKPPRCEHQGKKER